jgi:hypothetical protein
VAVVLTPVQTKINNNKYTQTKQSKNTTQTVQNTVNTSTHITKTPTPLSKQPHITKLTHTPYNKFKISRKKIQTSLEISREFWPEIGNTGVTSGGQKLFIYKQVYLQLIAQYLVFLLLNVSTLGRHSSVGIATRYGLDRLGIESWWRRDFPHQSRPALGLT